MTAQSRVPATRRRVGLLSRPRLNAGKGMRGPDYFGCCGTGMAPVIMRVRWDRCLYVIGPELANETLRHWLIRERGASVLRGEGLKVPTGTFFVADAGKVYRRDSLKQHRRKVVVRKSRKAAFDEFERQVRAMQADNQRQAEEARAEHERMAEAVSTV